MNLKLALFGLLTLGCFLFFGAGNVQAQTEMLQTSETPQKATSQTQLVSFPQALIIVADELQSLKTVLSSFQHGTALYNETLRTLTYYEELYVELQSEIKQDGTVGEAIEKALIKITGSQFGLNLTGVQLADLRQGAIDLLES